MPISSALSHSLSILGWCVISTLSVSGCLDAGSGPLTVAAAPENHASVLFSGELATVPRLLSDHGLALEGVAEVEAWWDSWKLDDSEGAHLRTQIYPSAAQRLFPVMGLAGLQDAMDQNALGLDAAGAVGAIVDSEAMSHALDRARGFHSEAWSALERGEGESALTLVLRTADALWEVSPEQVATELIERATDAMGRKPESASYSEEELIRIRRLMSGASEALEQGDYPRAIRRAYYACQLLGADPS
ncbi:MAG: hypothetical protein ABIF09_00670 [Gemmatimonadota bacterium]